MPRPARSASSKPGAATPNLTQRPAPLLPDTPYVTRRAIWELEGDKSSFLNQPRRIREPGTACRQRTRSATPTPSRSRGWGGVYGTSPSSLKGPAPYGFWFRGAGGKMPTTHLVVTKCSHSLPVIISACRRLARRRCTLGALHPIALLRGQSKR